MTISAEIKSRLRSFCVKYLDRSVSPYSRQRTAAVALLSTGEIVPAVRVETASFPLAIPAVINLITTAVAIDRSDVLVVAQSRGFTNPELSYLSKSPIGPFIVVER